MAIRRRRCSRCSSFFEPAKQHYRLCQQCSSETLSQGFTHSRHRAGGADRMHGGSSRMRDGTLRRPIALRGNKVEDAILAGFEEFATDYYGRPSDLSSILGYAGFGPEALDFLFSTGGKLGSLLMAFCPAFRIWVHDFAGEKAMELVIEYYGLYGDERLTLEELEWNLGLTNARGYKAWTLEKLRREAAEHDLREAARHAGNFALS